MQGASMMVFWHQLLGALLLPPMLSMMLAAAGWMLLRKKPRMGGLALLGGLLSMYLLSIPQTAVWLAGQAERYPPLPLSALARVDAIVVLGGGKKPAPEYGRNEPSADTLGRLRYAAFLARASGKPVLVTGGAPLGGEAEGPIMARTLREDYGIAPRWVEAGSNTTLENAALSAPLLREAGVKRIALVSQNWHLSRAAPFFSRQGFEVLPAPTGFIRYDGGGAFWWIPSGRAMQECHSLLRERLGSLFYRLKGGGGD